MRKSSGRKKKVYPVNMNPVLVHMRKVAYAPLPQRDPFADNSIARADAAEAKRQRRMERNLRNKGG